MPCYVYPGLILKSVVSGRFMKCGDSHFSVFFFHVIFLHDVLLNQKLCKHETLFTLHYKQATSTVIFL